MMYIIKEKGKNPNFLCLIVNEFLFGRAKNFEWSYSDLEEATKFNEVIDAKIFIKHFKLEKEWKVAKYKD